MRPEDFLTQKPQEYSTIYIDMDAFFASVEQYHQPELRNKPIGVATGTSSRASIIAASYEAKAAGVKTGTKVDEAIHLCPELRIVYGSPNSYRAVHRDFMTFLHSTICLVVPKGIDEAYLKVPSYARDKDQIIALLKAIKGYLSKNYNEQISCSLGVAPNIWLAKMLTNLHKPNGMAFVTNKHLAEFYLSIPLKSLTGVGPGMYKQMTDNGIYTTGMLYKSTWSSLTKYFGVNGQKWYLRMRGYEVDQIAIKQQKSLSHQATLNHKIPNSLKKITTLFIKIAEEIEKRLIFKKLYAQSIEIVIYFNGYSRYNNKIENVNSFNSSYEIIYYIKMLLKKLKNYENIKKIIVSVCKLTHLYQPQLNNFSYTYHNKPGMVVTKTILPGAGSTYSRADSFFNTNIELNKVGFSGDLVKEKY